MPNELKPCPFCGGEKIAELEAMGGEWVGLVIRGYGAVYPKICLNCGSVYIPKDKCEKILKRRADNE